MDPQADPRPFRPRRSRLPRRLLVVAAVAAATLVVGAPPVGARPEAPAETRPSAPYRVVGPRTWTDTNRVAQTGAAIDYIEHGQVYVTATGAEVAAIRRLGFDVVPVVQPGADADGGVSTFDFPSADSAYHNYAEMTAEIDRIVADHPAIARKQVIGTSYEGRPMVALKISDNVATDENEPEVLYDAHQHAREHLTVEMALYLANLFTGSYGTDSRITDVVDN